MRTTIRERNGLVVLTYEDQYTGDVTVREFASTKGGDVIEYDERGNRMFVGPRLQGGGWSLRVAADGLLATVRREWRRLQRAAP